jgi:outer membrane protein
MKKTMLIIAGALCSMSASANDQWEYGLGIGVIGTESPYQDVGTDTTVFPIIYAQKGNFSLLGNQAKYTLYSNGKMQFGVLGQYRIEGYEADDSKFLAGMDEREGAIELGLSASLQTQYGTIKTAFLTDASNTHDGHEVKLGWEKSMQLNAKWMLRPSAEINWRSSDLNNYYFGVKNSEATANRAVYTADSGMMYRAGVDAFYFIDPKQTVQIGLGITTWDNEIDDSSIVEHSSKPEVKAAYTFRF